MRNSKKVFVGLIDLTALDFFKLTPNEIKRVAHLHLHV